MQTVSDIWKRIVSGDYYTETSLVIGDSEQNPDNGYKIGAIKKLEIETVVFGTGERPLGRVAVGEIDIEMKVPDATIPRQAVLRPYIRVTNGSQTSEWIPKGRFLLDTRKIARGEAGENIIKLHGYDELIKAQMEYTGAGLSWPSADIAVVNDIAAKLGIAVDPRTTAAMTKGYPVGEPEGYSCGEVLGYIAAMYGGSFCMSDAAQLLLVQLKGA